MRILFCISFILAAGCYHNNSQDLLSLIQIQDRNGLTETISNPDRLLSYEATDFFSAQPYKKVLRVYKKEGKNRSKITTYHPNGTLCQYLEAEEMRAHGTYQEWFANGQIKLEAKVIGGTADLAPGTQEDWVFDQTSQVWDEQGHLIAQIPYDKGVLEGVSVYYFPNGQVDKEMPFTKDKLHGLSLEYWPSGALKSKTQYQRGIKEGESLGFFESGELQWVEEYSEGRLRTGSYYTPQGELVSEVTQGGGCAASFDDNSITLMEYRIGLPEGRVQQFSSKRELQRTFFLKNGLKQGEEIEYFSPSEVESGVAIPAPKMSVTWNEQKLHGCVKTWYNNGQLQSQREYCRNLRMGPSLAWYREGSLMFYEEYEEDRLVSGQYYKIHRKEPISSITQGTGLATLFDEMGLFLRKVHYVKGKPVDP